MGDLTYKQSVEIQVGKTSVPSGGFITQSDFLIDPADLLTVDDINESSWSRFLIPDGSVGVSLCKGTINLIKIMLIKPESDIELQLTNANGTSQKIKYLGGKLSILHGELTDVLATNQSGGNIKGFILFAGD